MFGLRFRLGFLFVLAASGASIRLSFLKPRLLFSCVSHCFCGNFTLFLCSVFLRLLFFLASLRFALGFLLLFSLESLFGERFLAYAVLFFLTLAIESILLVLSLFLEYVAFDVGALAAYLNIYSTRTALCTG